MNSTQSTFHGAIPWVKKKKKKKKMFDGQQTQ